MRPAEVLRATALTLKAWLKAALRLDRRALYSQFGEDGILFAYFWGKQWVPNRRTIRGLHTKGFYVDIGAYSPSECSNTYTFYLEGWRGVNVDPTAAAIRHFNVVRPRDRNIHAAVGRSSGPVTFYSWGETSVFNTTSATVAREHARLLGREPTVSEVPCLTLAEVLDHAVPAATNINFMSVDAEGNDLEVLESNDWSRFRPELVVVENHVTTIEAVLASPMHASLTSKGYLLYAWAPPSLVYQDATRAGDRVPSVLPGCPQPATS